MSKIDDGGTAFPGSADTEEGHRMREYGMSLRDYFAGQAMAAIIQADGAQYFQLDRTHALLAYAQADAMIEVRKGEAS